MAAIASDCNDRRSDVRPGADERCDNVDNDCDGEVDEGITLPTWYADADGDGHGDVGHPVQACTSPAGASAWSDDCDDADPTVSPSVAEICNGRDDDCDGLVDDDDPDREGGTAWYLDLDHDGYGGDTVAARVLCAAPDDTAPVGGDCDGARDDVNPGATEVCGSGPAGLAPVGVDEDCDGLVDDDDPSVDPAGQQLWYPDLDGDGLGDAAGAVLACVQPPGHLESAGDCDDGDPAVYGPVAWRADTDGDGWGQDTLVLWLCGPPAPGWVDRPVADCDDTDPLVSPGATDTCGDGVDQDCTGADTPCGRPVLGDVDTNAAGVVLVGELAGDELGPVAVLPDADGDGIGDLAVFARGWDQPWSTDDGAVYVFFGPLADGTTIADASVVLHGISGAGADGVLASMGDQNGDGLSDLAIGSPQEELPYYCCWYLDTHYGRARVYQGPPAVGGADGTVDGSDQHHVGAVMAGGDLNGDGLADLVSGFPGYDVGARPGPVVGDLYGFRYTVEPPNPDDGFGSSLAVVGDTDGDGVGELWVGAPTSTVDGIEQAGAAYLYVGPLERFGGPVPYGLRVNGDGAGALLGTVAGPGDVDGDGTEDLLVGAPSAAPWGVSTGAVYLLDGSQRGTLGAEAASSAWWTGEAFGDRAGDALAAGDIDGDGFGDAVIGGRGADDAGRVWVVFGPVSGALGLEQADVTVRGTEPGAAGLGVFPAVGDLTGDGVMELLIGMPGADLVGVDAGAVWMIDLVP